MQLWVCTISGIGVTVTDGAFFSGMPCPALACHSHSHLRHTPHAPWIDPSEAATRSHRQMTVVLRDAASHMPPGARPTSRFSF